LHGEPLLPDTRVTLEFYDGFVRGSAGCNKYDSKMVIGIGKDAEVRGKYKATEDGSLEIPGYSITLAACLTPDGAMEQEKAYLEALSSAATFLLMEDRLELRDAAGATVLVYTRRARPTDRPARLAGTAWQLVSVNDRVPAGGAATTLAFLDEEWFVEHSRCAGYVSSYQAAGQELRVFESWSLGRVCQDEEGYIVTLSGQPSDYGLVQGRLQITMLSGTTFLYEPLPEAAQPALEGPTWSLLSIVAERWIDGEPVPMPEPVPVREGSEITLTLEDGRASGSAGCNSYGASYTLDGVLLSLGEIAATEKACSTPERVMEQERRYLAALAGVTGYRMAGTQLWLSTEDGQSLAFAVPGTDR
jgi:heat shock protein HslJ